VTPPLPPPQPPKRRIGWIVGVVVALVVAGSLVVALLVTGGDDDVTTAAPDTVPPATVEGGVIPAETQPVEVDGEPLPPLPEPGADDAALGLDAPRLSGYSFDGSPLEVGTGGGSTLVVFLAHWCPHCNAEIPRLIEWQESGQVPDDLEIVGVATGSRADAPNYPPSEWLDGKGWPWPALADSEAGDAAAAYGLTGFPYFVLVGDDGTVLVRFSGEIEVDQLDGLVRAALAN
jgi:thiol-disulfide isomerase/thioredoxin